MAFQLQRVVFNMRIFLSIIFIVTTSLILVDQAKAACAADEMVYLQLQIIVALFNQIVMA